MKHVELSTGCHDCHTHCGQLCKALELLGMLTRCSQLTIGPSTSPSQGPANTKLTQFRAHMELRLWTLMV